MKCPACETDVPSGWSVCTRCGVSLPSAGGPAGPEPGPTAGSAAHPQAGPQNPKTEPLPAVWDEEPPRPMGAERPWGRDEERPWHAGQKPLWQADEAPPRPADEERPWHLGQKAPWDMPLDRFATPEATAAEPGAAPETPGLPAQHPRPLEQDPATQKLSAPPPGPLPHEGLWAGGNQDAPGTGPAPAGPDSSTRILGAPGPGPTSPPGPGAAGWGHGVPPLPGDPSAPPAPGGVEKDRKTPLLIGGIAAVAVLGGGLVLALTQGLPWSGDKTRTAESAPATGGASRQASAVYKVLSSGRTARGHLPSPLRTCDDVSAGVPGFQQVVRDRQQELSQSKALKVDGLQDGSRLRRSMVAAYQSSLDADQAYLAWAREVRARGCGGRAAPLTAHYKDAIAANGKAGPAKRQVVALWKPIAKSHGLPTIAWNRL
jgi:hypothetical protein